MAFDPKRDKPPLITPELLDYLDHLYRDQCPELNWDERKVWYMAGAVSVVRKLKQVKQEQENNVLRN